MPGPCSTRFVSRPVARWRRRSEDEGEEEVNENPMMMGEVSGDMGMQESVRARAKELEDTCRRTRVGENKMTRDYTNEGSC